MANKPHRYAGLDLPIYDPNTRLIRKRELDVPTFSVEESTFVRETWIGTPPLKIKSLKNLLKVTGDELPILAEKCGALIINHEFGLYPISHIDPFLAPHRDEGTKRLVPAGYVLAATVHTIRNLKRPSETALALLEGNIPRYEYEDRKGFRLSDVSAGQFRIGATDEIPTENIWYLDIEPRLT